MLSNLFDIHKLGFRYKRLWASLYGGVADYSWSDSIEKNSPTPQLTNL